MTEPPQCPNLFDFLAAGPTGGARGAFGFSLGESDRQSAPRCRPRIAAFVAARRAHKTPFPEAVGSRRPMDFQFNFQRVPEVVGSRPPVTSEQLSASRSNSLCIIEHF